VPTANISDPEIYESPRMFRHSKDIYLVARTDDLGSFYVERPNWPDSDLGRASHHLLDLGLYSTRPHGTALYRLAIDESIDEDPDNPKLIRILDLPGCGDTAFPSILRISQHKYRIVNYSSPWMEIDNNRKERRKCEEWSWVKGQTSDLGTLLYYVDVEFTTDG